jgi:hypothetical protein
LNILNPFTAFLKARPSKARWSSGKDLIERCLNPLSKIKTAKDWHLKLIREHEESLADFVPSTLGIITSFFTKAG